MQIDVVNNNNEKVGAFDVREESRLSCQIKVTEELDGLVVRVPEKQF